MDKSTLGSSAILGIQYGSKYISRCPVSTSGKLQGVWLRSLVVSILWLWALRALSFFDQLIFTFSVFEIEVDVFDHLQLLLGLSSEVTIFNLRHTLLGLSSEILNIITFTV